MLTLILLAVVVASQLVDVFTTHRILQLGGYERNPAAAWVIARAGLGGLLAAKLVLCGILGWLAMQWSRGWIVLVLLLAIYAVVIANNIVVIQRLRARA